MSGGRLAEIEETYHRMRQQTAAVQDALDRIEIVGRDELERRKQDADVSAMFLTCRAVPELIAEIKRTREEAGRG